MSLGWLQESTIAPKKAREIANVQGSTMLDLKAALYERETETRAGIPSVRVPKGGSIAQMLEKANAGVEERNKRDLMDSGELNQLARSQAIMQKKAKVYQSLVQGNVSGVSDNFMVDFESKGWQGDEMGSAATAAGAMLDNDITGSQYREAETREEWEKLAMQEIKEGKKAAAGNKGMLGVKAPYEHTLEAGAKALLKKASRDTDAHRAESRSQTLKRKKQQAAETRKLQLAAKKARNKRRQAAARGEPVAATPAPKVPAAGGAAPGGQLPPAEEGSVGQAAHARGFNKGGGAGAGRIASAIAEAVQAAGHNGDASWQLKQDQDAEEAAKRKREAVVKAALSLRKEEEREERRSKRGRGNEMSAVPPPASLHGNSNPPVLPAKRKRRSDNDFNNPRSHNLPHPSYLPPGNAGPPFSFLRPPDGGPVPPFPFPLPFPPFSQQGGIGAPAAPGCPPPFPFPLPPFPPPPAAWNFPPNQPGNIPTEPAAAGPPPSASTTSATAFLAKLQPPPSQQQQQLP